MNYIRMFLFVMAALSISFGMDAEEPFARLDEKVIETLHTRYTDAKLTKDKVRSHEKHFSRNTRDFVFYRLNKIGNWQAPRTVQGPDRGGIIVRYYISEGSWGGARLVPYSGTNDLHIFKESYVIRNSKDREWHIWAEILTPKVDPPHEIMEKLIRLFYDFEKYK